MEFEFKHALHDLDQRTPPYFVGEIFAHGSLEVRRSAVEALKELDPDRKSVRILKAILEIA